MKVISPPFAPGADAVGARVGVGAVGVGAEDAEEDAVVGAADEVAAGAALPYPGVDDEQAARAAQTSSGVRRRGAMCTGGLRSGGDVILERVGERVIPGRCHTAAMTSPPGLAGVFDRAAATYDTVGVPFFRPIAEGLVDELAPRPGERALDVGCGRGAVLELLARRVGPSGRAVGIDLAPEMVRRTAADLADQAHVEVRVDDAQQPSLTPGSFDLVASSLVIFFLDDPHAALVRWAGLLAPAGRIGVTTFGGEDAAWLAIDEVFRPHLPQQDAAEPGSSAPDPFDSDGGVERLLAEAGFAGVRTADRTVVVRFRDVEQLLAFSWSHGQRAMWEAVPEAERGDVRAELVSTVADLGLGHGGIAFTQRVRHTLASRG